MSREIGWGLRIGALAVAGSFVVLFFVMLASFSGGGPGASRDAKATNTVTTHIERQGIAVDSVSCSLPDPTYADATTASCDVTLAPPLSATDVADAIDTLAAVPMSDLNVPDTGGKPTTVEVGRLFVKPSSGCYSDGVCQAAPYVNIQSLDLSGDYVDVARQILRTAQPTFLKLRGHEPGSNMEPKGWVDIEASTVVAERADARASLTRLLNAVAKFETTTAEEITQRLSTCVGTLATCDVSVSADTAVPWDAASLAAIETVAQNLDDDRIEAVFVRMSAKTSTLSVSYRLPDGTACWDVPADVLTALPSNATAEGFTASQDDPDTLPSCTP